MRLSSHQLETITAQIYRYDSNAEIYLFGSRVDDNAKGGDIDLLVVSTIIDFAIKIKILAQLMIKLGEQKIDLVQVNNKDKVFTQIAISEGVLL
ncbi:MAG: putative nucleotidyltransferase [Phenylobacterium sp.]|jgi:predicted nucleotidyltransferase